MRTSQMGAPTRCRPSQTRSITRSPPMMKGGSAGERKSNRWSGERRCSSPLDRRIVGPMMGFRRSDVDVDVGDDGLDGGSSSFFSLPG